MHILVCEYGCSGLGASSSLANYVVEGFAMLRTLASDLSASGHEVTILLEKKLRSLSRLIPCNRIVTISSRRRGLLDMGDRTDGAYLIAPETGNLLVKLVSELANAGINTFNSTPDAIAVSSSKWLLHERLTSLRISTPRTILNRRNLTAHELVERLGLPLVAKPVRGADCKKISIAKTRSEIEEILRASKVEGSMVFQEYLEGTPASVSLLCGKNEAQIVSVNQQYIKPHGRRLEYMGGEVPLKAQSVSNLFRQAKRIVRSFPGLRGYVGIDLILTGNGAYFLDVNPRLTTSFIGISTVYGAGVADAIVQADSGMRRRIREPNGTCVFGKVRGSPNFEVPRELVVTPPISFSRKGKSVAFLKAHSNTASEARRIMRNYGFAA